MSIECHNRRGLAMLLLVAVWLLSACGGGGGTPAVTDRDGDGLQDDAELTVWMTDPDDADSDDDGLEDGDEVNNHGTSPSNNDSDGDGLFDGFEVVYLFDPLTGGEQLLDGDSDDLSNLEEQAQGTDPTDEDSDGDGLSDGVEVLVHATDPMTVTPTTTVKDGSVVYRTALEELGDALFNDTNLSVPAGQSCASCHTAAVGFDDPDDTEPTSLGVDGVSIGSRNAPTASYAAHIPDFFIDVRNTPGPGPGTIQVAVGGQFWDGRAESLEEQAKAPFLNPVEMANTSKADVIDKVRLASYADDFEAVFGAGSLDDVDSAYDYIADAIAAFERTGLFSPFSSKFDQWLVNPGTFTASEMDGRTLFFGKAQCSTCHSTNAGAQVFSNFEYFNIGVPANADLVNDLAIQDPMAPPFVDNGLGDFTMNSQDNGKFRTSSLRNIAVTAPYMHNGVFTTLQQVIEFYNCRDMPNTAPNCTGISFDAAEVNQNIDDRGNIGELGLSVGEIQDLIAFLNTLTDQ